MLMWHCCPLRVWTPAVIHIDLLLKFQVIVPSLPALVVSYFLGLILVRHNRTKHWETASELISYPWLGREALSIIFSLPCALLMWKWVFSSASVMHLIKICLMWIYFFSRDNSMVSFLIAFGFMCLQNSGRCYSLCYCDTVRYNLVSLLLVHMDVMEKSRATHCQCRVTDDKPTLKPKGFNFTRVNLDTKPSSIKRPTRTFNGWWFSE